jgi:hypothetical protein
MTGRSVLSPRRDDRGGAAGCAAPPWDYDTLLTAAHLLALHEAPAFRANA